MLEVDADSFASEGVSECSVLVLLSSSSSRLEDRSLNVVVTDRNNSGMDSFCIRGNIISRLRLFLFGKIKCHFVMQKKLCKQQNADLECIETDVLCNPFKYPAT